MGSKIIKTFVTITIVSYVMGWLLYPFRDGLQTLQNNHAYLSFLLMIVLVGIETLIALFIATNFFVVEKGEAHKLGLTLGILNLSLGIYFIISSSIIRGRLGMLSGQDLAGINLYSSTFTVLLQTAMTYALTVLVFSRRERFKYA